jgi:hypothetical protein
MLNIAFLSIVCILSLYYSITIITASRHSPIVRN